MTPPPTLLNDPKCFEETLFGVMKQVCAAVEGMALYEFRYALHNLVPEQGWGSVTIEKMEEIEKRVNDINFYREIQIKGRVGDAIVLDPKIIQLTRSLFAGLATGAYPLEWVNQHFFFDARGFLFLHRTTYFTEKILAHFGGEPFRQFEQKHKKFDQVQDIGYPEFEAANLELDHLFIECVQKVVAARGTPILLAIAGPTAAGKTEIVEHLLEVFNQSGKQVSSIELDNFLTDRDYREAKGIFTQGKAALHFELLQKSLADICSGKKTSIPRYDFVYATSSHDLIGNLKPGGLPIEIEPADIFFIEGNFPFLLEEIVPYIGIKVVYLTDDPVRMKRKWKRDIDYRKKYEPTYFRNRFFKDQFIMADFAYRPQLEICDIAVDTTGARLWVTPELSKVLAEAKAPSQLQNNERLLA